MKPFLCFIFWVGLVQFNWAQSNAVQLSYASENIEVKQDTAFYIAKSLYFKANKSSNPELLAKSALILGEIYLYQGSFKQASSFASEASELFRTMDNPLLLADSYILLGAIHQYARQFPLAKLNYMDALALYKANNHPLGVAKAYGWIGHYFEKINVPDTAIKYQHLALELLQPLKGSAVEQAKIMENIGSLHEDAHRYYKALQFFEQAYAIHNKHQIVVQEINNLNNIADIYRKTGQLDTAMVLADKVLGLAKQYNSTYQLRSAYRDKSKLLIKKGQTEAAYVYLDSALLLYSGMYSEENARRIAQLRTLYEHDKNLAIIQSLETEQVLNNRLNLSLFIAVLLLVAILVLIYFHYISKQKQQKQLLLEQEKVQSTEQELLVSDLKNTLLREQNLKTELLNSSLLETQLRNEIEIKGQALTNHTIATIRKNNFMQSLQEELKQLRKKDRVEMQKGLTKIMESIHYNFSREEEWSEFQRVFEDLHVDFFKNLKKCYPELSSTELKLSALLKLNINSVDAASILGVSQDSLRVARYRLKKKLQLDKQASLSGFLMLQ